jgi:hypothetical protein
MTMSHSNLLELYLRISPKKFHYLKFIIESYDNIALLSSYDSTAGIVVLRYPEGVKCELFRILESIAGKLSGEFSSQ